MKNTTTTWVTIPDFERFQISSKGKIKSLDRTITTITGRQITRKGKTQTTSIGRGGYPSVTLRRVNGYSCSQSVHRLMARCFVPNPQNKPFVNHLNGNKMDYSIENLEWVTRSENQKHALKLGLCKIPSQNKLRVIDSCTKKEFESMKAAARHYGMDYGLLKGILKFKAICLPCLNLAV